MTFDLVSRKHFGCFAAWQNHVRDEYETDRERTAVFHDLLRRYLALPPEGAEETP